MAQVIEFPKRPRSQLERIMRERVAATHPELLAADIADRMIQDIASLVEELESEPFTFSHQFSHPIAPDAVKELEKALESAVRQNSERLIWKAAAERCKLWGSRRLR